MVDHDPNGEAWEDWKRAGYDSYETFIEAKAGACPADDVALSVLRDPYPPDVFTPLSEVEWDAIHTALGQSGVEYPSDRMHAEWARHLADVYERKLNDFGVWPQPKPPPFLADDEGSDDPAQA